VTRPAPGLALALLAAVAVAAGCSSERAAAPDAAPSAEPLPVREPAVWLCRPTTGGLDDAACTDGLDAVAVTGAGSRPDPFEPAVEPAVDCFYVYPTVSAAPGTSAPREPEPAVVATVRAQAALLGEVCRLFVPVYRQVTRAAIASGSYFDPTAQALAQRDVVDAWHEYLNEDNDGRGVVLVGHSQGGMRLAQLVQEEVALRPAVRDRVVSAVLVGARVTVAEGAYAEPDVADQVGRLPVCREPGQTGCVVAWSTYAEVPPAGALFARAEEGRRILCTDPTVLSGRPGELLPFVPTDRLVVGRGLFPGVPSPDGAAAFVTYPGSGRAECRSEGGASWLHVQAAPGAPVPPSLTTGDGGLGPAWGLHAADVSLALGNLVELVRLQAEAWTAGG
jgi:hypothetical protein